MVETLLVYDTETTGIPAWHEPSGGPDQPHIVQLAAQLVDESGEVINQMDRIVKPDGWVSSEEALAIHGITTEKAMDLGIPEAEALQEFRDQFWSEATKRVGFSEPFDARILRIAMKRYRPEWCDAWKEFPRDCAKRMAVKHCNMGQRLTLIKAAQILLGVDMGDKAHDALVDVEHTVAVYFHVKALEAAAAEEGQPDLMGEGAA